MKGQASQDIVPIQNIKDGVIDLGNNEYRLILMISSLNLSLKSEDEQVAIISQFQNFFNSLDFPIQILCKSRRANIDAYIELMKSRVNEIDNDLLKLQTVEYISYIESFISGTNIMNKEFYVVIPYTSAIIQNDRNMLDFNKGNNAGDNAFLNIKEQLSERASVVEQGLARCGLRSITLGTKEAMELYYQMYNPGPESKVLI
jgi:hypothetical protein